MQNGIKLPCGILRSKHLIARAVTNWLDIDNSSVVVKITPEKNLIIAMLSDLIAYCLGNFIYDKIFDGELLFRNGTRLRRVPFLKI